MPSNSPRITHNWSPSTISKLKDDDVVVFVMGVSGSGRSTFINALLGPDCGQRRETGGSTTCVTTKVEHIVMDPIDRRKVGHRLVLVDTPGLDVPQEPDSRVYRGIGQWVKSNPAIRTSRRIVVFLRGLDGDRIHNREYSHTTKMGPHLDVALVTSKWSEFETQDGEAERRHKLVQEQWPKTIKWAGLHTFKNSGDAWGIIANILSTIGPNSSRTDLQPIFEELAKFWKKTEKKEKGLFAPLKRMFGGT